MCIRDRFGFDLKKHLEIIVLALVLVTTVPVIYKLVTGKKEEVQPKDDSWMDEKE